MPQTDSEHARKGGFTALTIGAIGIVFGDIGTSPLYSLNQIFFGRADVPPTPQNVLGGISLVLWTITIIISLKYAILVLRAQNDGEGGVFALYGLLHEHRQRGSALLLWALMLGAGLLFGDGFITPAISVLSAVEGVGVAAPALSGVVLPVTVVLLTLLFAVQFKGTAGIGSVFGPIVLVWFVIIALLGITQIEQQPQILAALNPLLGLRFLGHIHLLDMMLVLGALMLVMTGGEAMYADMGHFGVAPIRASWFAIVYPALMLNYLGQGAYLLRGAPVADHNLFFSLVPRGMVLPMVILATAATIIASQALISGAFTLASQAIRLGLFPRLAILHTHQAHAGHIYMPFINWALYAGCVLLVLGFGSSTALGAAYGLGEAGVMVITSVAMAAISHLYWNWSRARIALVWGTLTAINGMFLLASTLKFPGGGYVPLSIGTVMFLVMATWRWGRKATFAAYSGRPAMTMAELVDLHRNSEVFLEQVAILMSPKPLHAMSDRAPALFRLLRERMGILPRHIVFVEVTHRKIPYIHGERCKVTVFDRAPAPGRIIGVEMQFGFMEEPNVERMLGNMARHREIELPPDHRQWVVYVSHENLLPSRGMGRVQRLRFRLFRLMRNLSQPAYYYYGLGDEVQLSAEIMPVRVR